jgi:hypothetical protein
VDPDDGRVHGCGCPTALVIVVALVLFWVLVTMAVYSVLNHEWHVA